MKFFTDMRKPKCCAAGSLVMPSGNFILTYLMSKRKVTTNQIFCEIVADV